MVLGGCLNSRGEMPEVVLAPSGLEEVTVSFSSPGALSFLPLAPRTLFWGLWAQLPGWRGLWGARFEGRGHSL